MPFTIFVLFAATLNRTWTSDSVFTQHPAICRLRYLSCKKNKKKLWIQNIVCAFVCVCVRADYETRSAYNIMYVCWFYYVHASGQVMVGGGCDMDSVGKHD